MIPENDDTDHHYLMTCIITIALDATAIELFGEDMCDDESDVIRLQISGLLKVSVSQNFAAF